MNLLEDTSKNLFITGRAGTGKSTLLEYFRSITKKNVVVLAPTGVAALNVKGQTIHSFFHFKPDITVAGVKRLNRYKTVIYKEIDVLIIDEISMVRADLLDCVDRFMRLNGKNPSLPFGGVQIVLIGDLYQLSPVVTSDDKELFENYYESPYFFDSKVFKTLNVKLVELTKHYRQVERKFIDLLNAVRNNSITTEQLNEINSRFDSSHSNSNSYITLTTTNKLADEINQRCLSNISEKSYSYKAVVSGEFEKRVFPTDDLLTLKEGAQIMMLNNDPEGRWVNGSIGKIIKIEHNDLDNDILQITLDEGLNVSVAPYTWDVFRFRYDETGGKISSSKAGSFKQYPLMLAWAVTIHKSQGKTFDNVIIDVGYGTFAHGQLYVALSRSRTLDGIILKRKIEKRHILMDDRILHFFQKYKEENDATYKTYSS